MKFKIALCAFLLLLLSMGFNIMLTTASMEKVFTEAIVSEYTVIARDLQRSMDRSLRFGKRLDKFTGIERVLLATRAQIFKNVVVRHTPPGYLRKMLSEDDIVISVALPSGKTLYSTNSELKGETLPPEINKLFVTGDSELDSQRPTFVKYQNYFALALPITGKDGQVAAQTVITFGDSQVSRLLGPFFDHNLKMTGAIMVCGMALLILALNLLTHAAPLASGLPGKRISVVLFLVVGTAQVVFSGLNLQAFREEFLAINQAKATTLMTMLKEDIEFFFAKGLHIQNLNRMDELLGEIIDASPELSNIVVYDEDGKPLFLADQNGSHDFRTEEGKKSAPDPGPLLGNYDQSYRSHMPLMRSGKVHGHLVANVSRKAVFNRLTEIFKDSATVLVIAILFFVEMLILANLFIKDQYVKTGNGSGGCGGPPEGKDRRTRDRCDVPFTAIRPAAFLFLFGIDMCISFLPLYMKALYVPILGLSKEVVLGLPISVEMLFVGIAILISGTWIDRRGWHEPFWLGLVTAMAGTAWSWLAPDAIQFIASRGLVGVGYGCFLMSAQGFVVQQTGPHSKAQGMAQLWAGVFAGSICGGAAGAMMAERIGYRPVLMVGAFIILFAGAYAMGFLRKAMARPNYCLICDNPKERRRLTFGKSMGFLFNRDVFGLVALASIPGSLAFVGFMYYFSPVYLADLGETQSDIGRIYMLYGVCLIYIAPYISRFLDIADNQKFYIFLSGVVGCLGFTTFYFFGGMPATALTAFLLGLSGSFDASRAYVLKLKATHDLGEGTAMSLFNSVGRLGQVVGPMLFGWMLIQFGMPDAITTFGIGYLAVTVLFTMCTRSEKQLAAKGLLYEPEED